MIEFSKLEFCDGATKYNTTTKSGNINLPPLIVPDKGIK